MIATANTSTLDKLITFFTNFDISEAMEKSAETGINDIKERVSRGIASDNSVMDTNASDRVGKYSRRYANVRSANGKGTSTRDLNLTGEMIDDLGIIEKSRNRVTAGFLSSRQADKAEYNEIYMNKKAFDLSSEEERKIIESIEKVVSDKTNRL